MRATYQLQLKMAEASDITDMEPKDQIKAAYDLNVGLCEYLKNVLQLDDKDAEKLDDLDQEETIAIANHVAMRLMGLSEADIKKAAQSESNDAEKKASDRE